MKYERSYTQVAKFRNDIIRAMGGSKEENPADFITTILILLYDGGYVKLHNNDDKKSIFDFQRSSRRKNCRLDASKFISMTDFFYQQTNEYASNLASRLSGQNSFRILTREEGLAIGRCYYDAIREEFRKGWQELTEAIVNCAADLGRYAEGDPDHIAISNSTEYYLIIHILWSVSLTEKGCALRKEIAKDVENIRNPTDKKFDAAFDFLTKINFAVMSKNSRSYQVGDSYLSSFQDYRSKFQVAYDGVRMKLLAVIN